MDKSRLRIFLRQAAPWIITVILLAVVFQKVGFTKTMEQLRGHKAWEVVLISVVFYTYIFVMNSFSYYVLFKLLNRRVAYWDILKIRGASYLLTAINSGAGQGGMALWLSRKKNILLREVLGMMAVFPVVDLVFLAVMLSYSIVVHHTREPILSMAHIKWLYATAAITWILPIIHFLMWPTGFLPKHVKFFRESAIFNAYRNASMKDYAILLFTRFLMDIPGVFVYFAATHVFGIIVPFWEFVVRFFPTIIIQAAPISIGQLGTSQSAWILMYGKYADHAALAAFSLLWVTIYNISRIIIGVIFFRGEVKYYFNGLKQKDAEPTKTEPEIK